MSAAGNGLIEIEGRNCMAKGKTVSQEKQADWQKGDILSAVVTEVDENMALLDGGQSWTAILPVREYDDPAPFDLGDCLHIGDALRVEIIGDIDGDIPVWVSKLKVDRAEDWKAAETARKQKKIVKCRCVKALDTGLLVRVRHLSGFIPKDHCDLRFVGAADELEGRSFPAQILESDAEKRRLLLSHKIGAEDARGMIARAFETGQTLTGVVTKISPYLAFIDVNGVEGLMRASEASRTGTEKIKDIWQEGQEIEVKVKTFDSENGQITFSHKDCLPDPWDTCIANHAVGEFVQACVTDVMDFGVVLALDDGLEGLLPLEQMAENPQDKKPEEICRKGDTVTACIIGIDTKKKHMTFALVEDRDGVSYFSKEVWENQKKIEEMKLEYIRAEQKMLQEKTATERENALMEELDDLDIGHVTMEDMKHMLPNYVDLIYTHQKRFDTIVQAFVEGEEKQHFTPSGTWADPYIRHIVACRTRTVNQLLAEVDGDLKHIVHFGDDAALLEAALKTYTVKRGADVPPVLRVTPLKNGGNIYEPTAYGINFYAGKLQGKETVYELDEL